MRKLIMLLALMFCVVNTFAKTKSKVVYSLKFIECKDGCCLFLGNEHYSGIGARTLHYGNQSPVHCNNNRSINSEIDYFWSEVNRLDAVDEDNQNYAYSRTRAGGWYYVYRVSKESYRYYGNPSVRGDYDANVPLYKYIIWRVDVISK